MDIKCLSAVLADAGESIQDAAEETFILFSQDLPHNDLGIIDDKADEINITVNDHEYIITQSPGLLRSSRVAGTTGAMVWKVTPHVAQWLASGDSILWKRGILDSSKNIVELGCGVAGIIGLCLSSMVQSYVLTDQGYVLKLLKENIARNRDRPTRKHKLTKERSHILRGSPDNLHVLPFDWEEDSPENLKGILPSQSSIDIIIVCDCIYNDFLIEPLTQACVDVCRLHPSCPPVIIIAQQLRTDEVFEAWLTRFIRDFDVWRLKDEHLPESLQSNTGYVIHVGLLKETQ